MCSNEAHTARHDTLLLLYIYSEANCALPTRYLASDQAGRVGFLTKQMFRFSLPHAESVACIGNLPDVFAN